MKYLHAIDVLDRAGFRFALDYDDSLVWQAPAVIDTEPLSALVEAHAKEIAFVVLRRAESARARFYGGPLDGKLCSWFHPDCGTGLYHKGVRVDKAKWATYRLEADGRAFFVGYAASEAKARHGEVQPSSVDPESTERRALGESDA